MPYVIHLASKGIRALHRHVNGGNPGCVTIALAAGSTAWDPASTKTSLRGPANVRYEFFADGGINTTLLPYEPSTSDLDDGLAARR